MLPYIAQPVLRLGPLQIHAFGILVAAAVLVAAAIARRRARARGLYESVMGDLLTWVVGFGFVGGHVIDLVLYEPGKVGADPLSLLRLWESLGSFGGFVGAVAGALLFFHRRGIVRQAWQYLDVVAYAFPFGWIFGRLGCALAFDHPGVATEVFFGQRYSDGVVRHNLGSEEALFTIVIAGAFYVLGRTPRRIGFFLAALPLVYPPVRFLLDALRVGDARYGGLTPAQFGSVALLLVGFALVATLLRARPRPHPSH